jgi:hypothetical protein
VRPLGFVCIVIGFVVVALGVAQSMEAIPATQLSSRSLEMIGALFCIIGFVLTTIAGSAPVSSTFIAPAGSPEPPTIGTRTFTVTKTITGFAPSGAHVPGVVERLVDASSKALLSGMLADLDDPAKRSKIQIEGGDPEQITDQLRKYLSSAEAPEADTTASLPDNSADGRSKQLQELDDLHNAGVLSDEQYQAVRAKLLG